jgi:hypothetical protein
VRVKNEGNNAKGNSKQDTAKGGALLLLLQLLVVWLVRQHCLGLASERFRWLTCKLRWIQP